MDVTLVLPSTFMRVLVRALKASSHRVARFHFGKERVVACLGNPNNSVSHTVETWPIPGQFPNYGALAPETHAASATVRRDVLLGALKRARAFGDRSPVVINFEERLIITSGFSEDGLLQEEVSADVQGTRVAIAFDPRFLLEGVMASEGGLLRLDVSDDSTPAVLRSLDDDGFLYVLMPVRLDT